jgi:hypothetical protein
MLTERDLVRDVLGHANISMTSRYLRSATSGLARTLDRLASWKDDDIRTSFAHGATDDVVNEPESDSQTADNEGDEGGSPHWTISATGSSVRLA